MDFGVVQAQQQRMSTCPLSARVPHRMWVPRSSARRLAGVGCQQGAIVGCPHPSAGQANARRSQPLRQQIWLSAPTALCPQPAQNSMTTP